nr:unnamed protein product [Callosobruchus chinensis]
MENSGLKIWYLRQYRKKYTRRCNIHEINKSRHKHGEIHLLYELREHPEKFYSYFRMNISTFDYILDKIIEHKQLKTWTNFIRTPINSAKQQNLYMST